MAKKSSIEVVEKLYGAEKQTGMPSLLIVYLVYLETWYLAPSNNSTLSYLNYGLSSVSLATSLSKKIQNTSELVLT